MKKSIFGFILAILLICPFMSQVLRAEARDTDSKVTDADKIFYYSFDNITASGSYMYTGFQIGGTDRSIERIFSIAAHQNRTSL